MNAFPDSHSRVAWLRTKLSAALLVSLLQRSPVLHVVQSAARLASAPVVAVLKSAVATYAALGAVHSLAGATSLVASQPSPVTLTQGQAITPIAFTVSDTINLGSWRLGGTLPPGLKLTAREGGAELSGPGVLDATTPGNVDDYYGYGDATGGNTMTLPLLVGTPTQAGEFTITLQAYQLGGLTGYNTVPFSYTINIAAAAQTNAPPTFTTQPAPQNATVGATVTLSGAATGTPAPRFQWQKGGTAIASATNATLTLSNLQMADAGTYTLVATNDAGEARSTPVTVAVTNPGATTVPAMARQPQPQTVVAGSTVVFNADATGAPLTFQWRKNGTVISGATNASLVLSGATPADAGSYSVVISNAAGSTTSSNAALLLTNDQNFGHLVNLSIRTSITANEPTFTVGTVVGGAGTSGTKPILVRAVGPSLASFGLAGAIADSRVEVFAGSAIVATNNDWSGDAALTSAFAQVGAFPLASGTSKDAAIYSASFPARDYTVEVGGVGGATGEVLAELYDATSTDAFTSTTPRLVNVSVRKQINAGASLTVGFVIGGNTARTVLIRAIGPGLAAFGVTGTMPDPQLALFNNAQTKVVENDNWGGDPQITTAGTSVGAFAIANAAGRDAMLLTTLAPGGYTVEVSGVPNTGGGSALIEVYEVP
jgi:hypothetical protein